MIPMKYITRLTAINALSEHLGQCIENLPDSSWIIRELAKLRVLIYTDAYGLEITEEALEYAVNDEVLYFSGPRRTDLLDDLATFLRQDKLMFFMETMYRERYENGKSIY